MKDSLVPSRPGNLASTRDLFGQAAERLVGLGAGENELYQYSLSLEDDGINEFSVFNCISYLLFRSVVMYFEGYRHPSSFNRNLLLFDDVDHLFSEPVSPIDDLHFVGFTLLAF